MPILPPLRTPMVAATMLRHLEPLKARVESTTLRSPGHHIGKPYCLHIKALHIITQLVLLQPLRWCYVDCAIHHERDVREE